LFTLIALRPSAYLDKRDRACGDVDLKVVTRASVDIEGLRAGSPVRPRKRGVGGVIDHSAVLYPDQRGRPCGGLQPQPTEAISCVGPQLELHPATDHVVRACSEDDVGRGSEGVEVVVDHVPEAHERVSIGDYTLRRRDCGLAQILGDRSRRTGLSLWPLFTLGTSSTRDALRTDRTNPLEYTSSDLDDSTVVESNYISH